MDDITHAVLAERISDLKTDLVDIKSEMKEQRITMQSVLIQMASMSSALEQNHDDISELSDRMLILERPKPRSTKTFRNSAIVTGLLGVVMALIELLKGHRQ